MNPADAAPPNMPPEDRSVADPALPLVGNAHAGFPFQKFISRTVWALLLAYTLHVFVAWAISFAPSELESSWYMVLQWAFLKRADFGNEIIFTYGPLGFLFQGFHPRTFVWIVLTWMSLGAVWFATLYKLGRRLNAPAWATWIVMAGVTALVGTGFQMMGDARIFIACWSLVMVHFFVDPRPVTLHKTALVLVIAVVGLGKFSLALLAGWSVLLVSLDLIQRGRAPWLLGIWFSTSAILWLAVGQPISGVVPYLRHALEISSGYSHALGVWSVNEWRDVLFYIVVAGGLVGMVGLSQVPGVLTLRRQGYRWLDRPLREAAIRAIIILGGLVPALMLLFKMGYVRHDGHEIVATTTLAVLAIMYLAALWRDATARPARALLVVVPILALVLSWFSYFIWDSTGLFRHMGRTLTVATTENWTTLRSLLGDRVLHRRYEELLADYRHQRGLPQLQGTIDGFSFIQRSVLSHGLDYHPRPAFQGYLTVTPGLARLNAEHYRGDRAARWVLFDPQTIDQMMPSMLDAPTWPEILARYRPAQVFSGAVLLERVEQAAPPRFTAIAERTARLGDWIDVPPSNEAIWLETDFHQTAAGRMTELVYKSPPIQLDFKLLSGKSGKSAIIPNIAAQGFLLSPMVANRDAFALLYADRMAEFLENDRVVQIRIHAGRSGTSTFAYDPEFTLRFSELRYPRYSMSDVPGYDAMMRTRWMENDFWLLASTAPPRRMRDEADGSILLCPPTSRVMVRVPRSATRVQLRFGILTTPFEQYTPHPVQFQVYGAEQVGEKIDARPLWNRRVDPITQANDRGPQSIELILPNPAPSRLVLETIPGGPIPTGASYWSGVDFR